MKKLFFFLALAALLCSSCAGIQKAKSLKTDEKLIVIGTTSAWHCPKISTLTESCADGQTEYPLFQGDELIVTKDESGSGSSAGSWVHVSGPRRYAKPDGEIISIKGHMWINIENQNIKKEGYDNATR
ncbi:hypothetical protein A3K55_00400 [Candidatus Shapirobacteria bacterium RBG_13_44_7]|uniref:Lipoprotein n=1 Tax=Candidatus Shapirobacteria bacterium RBG_13_44_7 TaxID=1802149 RepID=A0A1F7SGL9_9BACT|nr:MAG: hypothetical protein A3K55_00400 [Candidatus Shapirobacteria bacterium RBG_13_44_7]